MTKTERAKLVDEFVDLDRTIATYKTNLDRHKELRDTILSWYADLPADQTAQVHGKRYAVLVTPRQFQQRITSMAKVKAKLGLKLFLELCSFTLKNLNAHIPTSEQAGLVTRERTGHRNLEVIPSEPATPSPARSAQ